MQLKIVVSNEWTFEVNLIKGPNKAGMNLILTKKLLPVAGEKSIIGKSVAEVAPIGSQSIGGQQQGPVNQRGSHRKKRRKGRKIRENVHWGAEMRKRLLLITLPVDLASAGALCWPPGPSPSLSPVYCFILFHLIWFCQVKFHFLDKIGHLFLVMMLAPIDGAV